jgi:hypothetical protein
MKDILCVLKLKEIIIKENQIRVIIKKAGYKYRNAKKVLTSTDPQYREKLIQITSVLSSLGTKDKFLSIDEFGPFSIKMQGGKSLVHPNHKKIVPQNQINKGMLIITGALELSTNQMIYFIQQRRIQKK